MDPHPPGETSADAEAQTPAAESATSSQFSSQFRDRFETLLPSIQREWPEVARHTLEATRGSFDTVVEVIARQTGRTSDGVKEQLLDLLTVGEGQAQQWADSLGRWRSSWSICWMTSMPTCGRASKNRCGSAP